MGNTEAVSRSVERKPNDSICHRDQQLDLCLFTLWEILRIDLGLQSYKNQLVQELKPMDHRFRTRN